MLFLPVSSYSLFYLLGRCFAILVKSSEVGPSLILTAFRAFVFVSLPSIIHADFKQIRVIKPSSLVPLVGSGDNVLPDMSIVYVLSKFTSFCSNCVETKIVVCNLASVKLLESTSLIKCLTIVTSSVSQAIIRSPIL